MRSINTRSASTEACPSDDGLGTDLDIDGIELVPKSRKDLPESATGQRNQDGQDNDVFNNGLPITIVEHVSPNPLTTFDKEPFAEALVVSGWQPAYGYNAGCQ
jgi:hypothetical protein